MNFSNISNYTEFINPNNININLNQVLNKSKPLLTTNQIQYNGVMLYSSEYLRLFITRNFYVGLAFYILFILQYFFFFKKFMLNQKMTTTNKLYICSGEVILLFLTYLHIINIFYLFDYVIKSEIIIQFVLTLLVIPLFLIAVNIVFYTISLAKTLEY